MAGEQENQQQGAPPVSDAQKAFEAETAGFASPKVVQAAWAEEREALIGNAQPTVTAEGDDNGAVDNGSGEVGAAAESGAADDAAAAGEADAGAAGEGGKDDAAGKTGEIPAWLKQRVERVSTKERAVDTEAQQIAQQRQEIADREAAVAAREKAAGLTKPDPDAFDDVADYDAAKATYDAAQREAKDAEAKVKKPAAEDRPATAAPALPLGLTPKDMAEASDTVASMIPASMVEKLAAPTTTLPHAVLIVLAAQPTKEATEQMTRFILGNQPTIKAIAKLPPVQQGAALVQAFNEKPPAERRQKTGAAEPIEPVGGSASSGRNLADMTFAEYERAMNKAEQEARASGRPTRFG